MTNLKNIQDAINYTEIGTASNNQGIETDSRGKGIADQGGQERNSMDGRVEGTLHEGSPEYRKITEYVKSNLDNQKLGRTGRTENASGTERPGLQQNARAGQDGETNVSGGIRQNESREDA